MELCHFSVVFCYLASEHFLIGDNSHYVSLVRIKDHPTYYRSYMRLDILFSDSLAVKSWPLELGLTSGAFMERALNIKKILEN